MCKPTKLTPQVHDTLCRSIALGAPRSTACKAAGITYETFHLWEKQAREGQQPQLHLFQDLEKAEGERINTWLTQIESAAQQGSWQAAAWKLERLGGGEFAPPPRRIEMDLNVDVASLSDQELDAIISGPKGQLAPPRSGGEGETAA